MAPLRLPAAPADVRAQPGPPAGRLTAHLATGPGRRSGPSATTATRGSPTAATRPASSSTSSPRRWPRARTRWCRSAASSPTTPGRWPRRRAPRAAVRAGAGELGPGLDRPAEHPGRQHHAEPGHGRRGPAGPGGLRHRLPGLVAAGALGRRGAWREPTPSRREPRTTRSAASGSPTGPRGAAAGARARRLLRHGHGVHGHRLDARRDGRRVRRAQDRRHRGG